MRVAYASVFPGPGGPEVPDPEPTPPPELPTHDPEEPPNPKPGDPIHHRLRRH